MDRTGGGAAPRIDALMCRRRAVLVPQTRIALPDRPDIDHRVGGHEDRDDDPAGVRSSLAVRISEHVEGEMLHRQQAGAADGDRSADLVNRWPRTPVET